MFSQLRETEVEHLDDAVTPEHDVVRLEIAMDDASCMGGGHRACDLQGDPQGLLEGKWGSRASGSRQPLLERLAIDEFEQQKLHGSQSPASASSSP